MNINERERKLLTVFAIVLIVFLIAYLILPKYREIVLLKSNVEAKNGELAELEAKQIGLETAYNEKQKTLSELEVTEEDTEEETSNYDFYKEITDAQILVEINKFIPVSDTDKFIIEEIKFLENDALDTNADGTTSSNDTGGITERNDAMDQTLDSATSISNTDPATIPDVNAVDGAVTDTSTTDTSATDTSTTDGSVTDTTNTTENVTPSVPEDNYENLDSILADYGLEKNLTKVVFRGYYGSLIKFADALNNNENYVAILQMEIKNIALEDPSLQKNIIEGEMIIAFPTYTGSENLSDVYALLDNMYVTSNKDPFNPYDGFVTVDDSFIDNSGNNGGSIGGNGSDTDEVVYKVIESFNKSASYFFVTNDNRNGGYVSGAQKSTDGNPSLKLYYDFYNRNNKNIAYAVNQNASLEIEMTPEQILVDVFNDSASENQFGVVYRDATGADIEAVAQNLDFNGWATYTIPLPDNVVYPIVIQRFYVRSGGSGVKQEGTVLIDNLRIIEY